VVVLVATGSQWVEALLLPLVKITMMMTTDDNNNDDDDDCIAQLRL